MPQAFLEVGLWLVEVVGVEAATASLIVSVAYYAAAAALLNAAVKVLTPSPPRGVGRSLEVNVTDATAPLRVLYGTLKVGGVNVIPPFNSGGNGEVLHQVIALAGHEVDSITDVYFNQDKITSASIGSVTGSANDGLVSSGTYANAAYIRRYTGTASQTRDWRLNNAFPSAFGTDFRGRGIAYVVVDYIFNTDIYPTGLPNATFTVKGKKLYDPRLDVTPGASPTNPSYIAWSSNPALVLADYLMADYGGGYDSTEIDWSLVVAAANVCDVSLTTTVAPPSGAQSRYTCNLALQATDDFLGNCKLITDTMLGRFIFRDGLWRIYAGAWASPVHTMDSSCFVGPVTIQASSPRDQRYNGVRAFFVNSAKNWQRVECFPRQNATYKTADGSELIQKEIELPGCTDEYQAQRICEFLLRQSRNQIQVSGLLGPQWQRLALWETVSFDWPDMGWSSKTFRVVAYSLNPNGSVQVGLKEEQSGDWTDLLTAEYNNPSTSTMPTTNPTTPSNPLNFSVFAFHGTLLFDWDPPTTKPEGILYQLWSAPGSASLNNSGRLEWTGAADHLNFPVNNYDNRWWWVRAIIPNSIFSGVAPGSNGLFARAFLGPEHQYSNRAYPDGEMVYPSMLGSHWYAMNSAKGMSLDTSNGLTAGRGGITLTFSGSTGISYDFVQFYPRPSLTEPNYPKAGPGLKGQYVYAWMRLNSGQDTLKMNFAVEVFLATPNTKQVEDFVWSQFYTAVETQHNIGSYNVGSWNYGSIPFTLTNSPVSHLRARFTQAAQPTSGAVRIGLSQIYFQ